MEHNWKIYNLKRTIAEGIVTKVTYGCESNHENTTTRKVGEFSVTGSVDDPGFIAFENLTQEDVLGWIDTNIDKAAIETANSSSIAEVIVRIASRTEITGMPW